MGAVIFNDYDACNVEVTCVGHGWTRGVIREIARYCFTDLMCARVSITTRASNDLVKGLAERLGGKPEGIKRRYYGDEDAAMYGVLKNEFRYEQKRPGAHHSDRAGEFISGETVPHTTVNASAQDEFRF